MKSKTKIPTDRYDFHTSSVLLSRLPIFAPVKRFPPGYVPMPVEFENRWGEIRADRQLTQVHRDIIDYIFAYHQYRKKKTDIGQTFFFSAYDFCRKLGRKESDIDWVKSKLEEMKNLNLQITCKNGDYYKCTSIVHEYGYEAGDRAVKPNQFGPRDSKTGERQSYRPFFVSFSAAFLEILEKDMKMYYAGKVADVLEIESPLIKTVVRFAMTHGRGFKKWYAEKTLIKLTAIRADMDRTSRWRKLDELRRYEEELGKFGITLSSVNGDTRISYQGNKEVRFKGNDTMKKAVTQ